MTRPETTARDPQGRFATTPRFSTINRYISDPAYRAQMDAERNRVQASIATDRDRAILANYDPANFDEEPGWVSTVRARIAGEVA